MPKKTDAKELMARAAAELFQRQGYHGTGLAEIIAHSGAPKGSIYHHFPGGKEDLAKHALSLAGEDISALVARCFANDDSFEAGVGRLAKALAQWFDNSAQGNGCPIAAVLIDAAADSSLLRDLCGSIFADWATLAASQARGHGFEPDHADALGRCTVTAMEGAWILARASNTSAPFEDAYAMVIAYAGELRVKEQPISD
jgi:TetR/AcrR family transcriptional repressor of lmrAB and yxaGH operons